MAKYTRGIAVMSKMQRQIGLHTARRVWAAMSANPLRSKIELARELAMPRTTFYDALRRLQTAGYIKREGRAGWVVVVPFIVTGKPNAGALN